MSDLGNYFGAAGFGILSAFSGYHALESLLDYTNIKAIALQTQISNASEITKQVYKTAEKAAERVASGDYYSGLFSAGIAGFFGGFAIYCACRKSRD